MAFSLQIGARRHFFADLKTLMAKASPRRSGDEVAGVAARDAEERVAAQCLLAEVPLDRFVSDPIIPPEVDEVTRLILDRHDAAAFSTVAGMTVGAFREWLLDYATDGDTLAAVASISSSPMPRRATPSTRPSMPQAWQSNCARITRKSCKSAAGQATGPHSCCARIWEGSLRRRIGSAFRLAHRLNASRQRGLSGVALMDDSPGARIG